MFNRFLFYLLLLFFVGILVFFIYEKSKKPGLTIVKKGTGIKTSQNSALEEIKGLMQTLLKNPNDEKALERLGNIFSSMGEWDKAIYFYKRLETQRQNDPKVKEKVAMCYFYMHEYVLSFKKLKEVLVLDPDNVPVHFNIGLLYAYFLDDKAEAKKHFLFVVNSGTKDKKLKAMAEEEIKKIDNKSAE